MQKLQLRIEQEEREEAPGSDSEEGGEVAERNQDPGEMRIDQVVREAAASEEEEKLSDANIIGN